MSGLEFPAPLTSIEVCDRLVTFYWWLCFVGLDEIGIKMMEMPTPSGVFQNWWSSAVFFLIFLNGDIPWISSDIYVDFAEGSVFFGDTPHLSACVGSVFRRSCKARRIGDGNFQLSRRESDRQRNLCRSWGFAIPKWPPMVKMSGGSQFMFVLVCWYIAWVCPTSFCDFTTCDHHICDLCLAGAVVLKAKLEGFAASSRAPSQRASWHTPFHNPSWTSPAHPARRTLGRPVFSSGGALIQPLDAKKVAIGWVGVVSMDKTIYSYLLNLLCPQWSSLS